MLHNVKFFTAKSYKLLEPSSFALTLNRFNIKLTINSRETMKLDTKNVRTYDKDGFKRRAACLCVRVDPESQVS